MNDKYKNSEKGQAIVYLAIGLVVFLGFVALAIDGGMALADRRHSQNGADSASLAGGAAAAVKLEQFGVNYDNWNCNTGSPVEKAKNWAEKIARDRATANNFSIVIDATDHNDVNAECGSTTYYADDGSIWFVDKYIDVTVEISATTPSNFLQLVFPTALHNEVDAVTRVHPPQSIGFGYAIVALHPGFCTGNDSGGVIIGGSGTTTINGGGIFSNGCIINEGGPTLKIENGGVFGNRLDKNYPNDWIPQPAEVDFQFPTSNYDIDPPNCSDPAAHVEDSLPLYPETMEPGLWCITNPKGIKINAGDRVDGDGVTIYVTSNNNNTAIFINGQAELHLSAPDPKSDSFPAIPGVLFYVDTTIPVTLDGTSGTNFDGMIFAPRSLITLNGNSKNNYNGQVIGWDVKLTGNVTMNVNFNSDTALTNPTSIELAK